jgi:pantoate--beta-alanine ligase
VQRLQFKHEVRARLDGARRNGQRIGFVPTMGNLHAGHLKLVEVARQHADLVIASVFVNPTQFGPNEDFARYPRTLEADSTVLQAAGCDVLFAPSAQEMYPNELRTEISVGGLENVLCGAFRPGHFRGVATVVGKLFGIVRPDVAVFGRKDCQQLAVIEQMTRDLDLGVEIIGVDTVREADGLAMSSRNQYLDATQRQTARCIYTTMLQIRDRWATTTESVAHLEAFGREELTKAGYQVDYVVLRQSADLQALASQDQPATVLIAARLGATRLIDNLAL